MSSYLDSDDGKMNHKNSTGIFSNSPVREVFIFFVRS